MSEQVTKLTEERIKYLVKGLEEISAAHFTEVYMPYDDTLEALRELLLLRKREEWIKVSERLPETSDVIWVHGVNRQPFGTYQLLARCSFGSFHAVNGELLETVTHWRPIPDAPTKD